MEIKAQLKNPYTTKAKEDFIVENNHNLGYEIKETDEALEAWGYTEEEKLAQLKDFMFSKNTSLAKNAVENGYVTFKGAQFETNAQTVGDLTASMLLVQQAGLETYSWLTKDDKIVELSLEDFGELGGLIAQYKIGIWNGKYLNYKALIESAETVEELEEIKIEY